MARVVGHRIAGPIPHRAVGQRHYVAGAAALIGIGFQAYGVSQAGGGGRIPTAVRARMAEEQRRADDAYQLQLLLRPYILDQMGLQATFDSAGRVTGITKRALTQDEQQQQDIKRLANEKVLKGLKGELDIDPAATRSLNERQANLDEYLSRTLGPDYKTSTAGSTQLQREAESRTVTESSLRRGEMTAAEAIAEARTAEDVHQQDMALALARGVPTTEATLGQIGPDASIPWVYQRQMQAGQAAGYASVGGGLLKGAGALYGAMRARNTPEAYNPSNPAYSYYPGVDPSGWGPGTQGFMSGYRAGGSQFQPGVSEGE